MLRILYLPCIWFLILVINGVANFVAAGQTSNLGEPALILLTITNILVLYTPVLDLVFFIYLVRKLNDVVEVDVRCWRKLLMESKSRKQSDA